MTTTELEAKTLVSEVTSKASSQDEKQHIKSAAPSFVAPSVMSHSMAAPSFRNYTPNPFATPQPRSYAPSESGYFPSVHIRAHVPRQRKFVSARLKPGEYDDKPFLKRGKDDPNFKRRRWEKVIFWMSILLGLLIGVAICIISWLGADPGEFCPIWTDDFSGGKLDTNSWSYEFQRGGFGTGSFEWTTDDSKNSYIDSEGLHIVPTLTTESTNLTLSDIYNGASINMTMDGTCTSTDDKMCSIKSNATTGQILNPVRSARLITKHKRSIRYGRVEVVAKMPKGDWLWPAIWMMPEDSKYGDWPKSGEIDIAESRGNAANTYDDGRNSIISALHWGATNESASDNFWRTSSKHNIKRTDYAAKFHTYGMEWTDKYLYTYIDSKLLQVFFIKWNDGALNFWDRGQFGKLPSVPANPWSQGTAVTPFDQSFYLILNVAVGGTSGFWPQGKGKKPWDDNSDTSMKSFYDARSQWQPTWGDGDSKGMTVKSVKMWKQGSC